MVKHLQIGTQARRSRWRKRMRELAAWLAQEQRTAAA
jgi:hypothetical protein